MKIKKRYILTFFITVTILLLVGILSTRSSVEAFSFYRRRNSLGSKTGEPSYTAKTVTLITNVPVPTSIPQEIIAPTSTPSISITPIITVSPTAKNLPTPMPSLQKRILGITAAPKTTAIIPKPSIQSNSSITDTIVALVNKERAAKNLPALVKNQALTNSAQGFATHLAQYNFLSHTGKDGSTMVSRNTASGYTNYKWMGENVASGQSTADQVMNSWMNSQGHRENILSANAKEIGVGYAYNPNSTYKYFWVEEFGGR